MSPGNKKLFCYNIRVLFEDRNRKMKSAVCSDDIRIDVRIDVRIDSSDSVNNGMDSLGYDCCH